MEYETDSCALNLGGKLAEKVKEMKKNQNYPDISITKINIIILKKRLLDY